MIILYLKVLRTKPKIRYLVVIFQPDSIRVMGDKSTARDTMKNAGVPTVPGSDGLLQVLSLISILGIMKASLFS